MAKELKVDKPITMGDVTVSPFVSAGFGDAPVGKTGLQLEYDGGDIDPYAEVSEVATLKEGALSLSTHYEAGLHIHTGKNVEVNVGVTHDIPQNGEDSYGVSAGVKWSF